MALSKRFKIFQFKNAIEDLDNAINYYNDKKVGLGKRFYLDYKATLKAIKRNPYYRVYYNNIRCLKISVFPYLIHFSVDEENKLIFIEAIICTHKDPNTAYLNI